MERTKRVTADRVGGPGVLRANVSKGDVVASIAVVAAANEEVRKAVKKKKKTGTFATDAATKGSSKTSSKRNGLILRSGGVVRAGSPTLELAERAWEGGSQTMPAGRSTRRFPGDGVLQAELTIGSDGVPLIPPSPGAESGALGKVQRMGGVRASMAAAAAAGKRPRTSSAPPTLATLNQRLSRSLNGSLSGLRDSSTTVPGRRLTPAELRARASKSLTGRSDVLEELNDNLHVRGGLRGNRPKSAPSVEAPLGGPVGDAASEAFNLYYDPMVLRAVRRGEKVLGQKLVDRDSLGSTLADLQEARGALAGTIDKWNKGQRQSAAPNAGGGRLRKKRSVGNGVSASFSAGSTDEMIREELRKELASVHEMLGQLSTLSSAPSAEQPGTATQVSKGSNDSKAEGAVAGAVPRGANKKIRPGLSSDLESTGALLGREGAGSRGGTSLTSNSNVDSSKTGSEAKTSYNVSTKKKEGSSQLARGSAGTAAKQGGVLASAATSNDTALRKGIQAQEQLLGECRMFRDLLDFDFDNLVEESVSIVQTKIAEEKVEKAERLRLGQSSPPSVKRRDGTRSPSPLSIPN